MTKPASWEWARDLGFDPEGRSGRTFGRSWAGRSRGSPAQRSASRRSSVANRAAWSSFGKNAGTGSLWVLLVGVVWLCVRVAGTVWTVPIAFSVTAVGCLIVAVEGRLH
jgi:hypothetical protein